LHFPGFHFFQTKREEKYEKVKELKKERKENLDPRGRNAMVVKVSGESVLSDLLKDGDEARHEVFEDTGVVHDDRVEERQSGAHHAGVFIAESPADLVQVVRHAGLVHLVQSVHCAQSVLANDFHFVRKKFQNLTKK
jgi:hypothetical protein